VGIPTDPGYKLYSDDCVCWPDGQTPKKLFAAVNGISRGSGLPMIDIGAPNGGWRLEWSGPCLWVGGNARWRFEYHAASDCYFFVGLEMFFFACLSPVSSPDCSMSFCNRIIATTEAFYGGNVALMSRD